MNIITLLMFVMMAICALGMLVPFVIHFRRHNATKNTEPQFGQHWISLTDVYSICAMDGDCVYAHSTADPHVKNYSIAEWKELVSRAKLALK